MIVKICGGGFSFDHLRKSDEGAVTHIIYNLMLALLLEYVCHNKNTSLGDLRTGIKYISTWYSSKYKVLPVADPGDVTVQMHPPSFLKVFGPIDYCCVCHTTESALDT